jgi:hypothetical protein
MRIKTNRFQKGSGCYECQACHKKTRSTGRNDNENLRLCEQCYDEGGLVNEHTDNNGEHYGYEERKHPDCPSCKEN